MRLLGLAGLGVGFNVATGKAAEVQEAWVRQGIPTFEQQLSGFSVPIAAVVGPYRTAVGA